VSLQEFLLFSPRCDLPQELSNEMFRSMLLLLRLCATDCNIALGVDVQDQIEKLLALLPGLLFKCDMLVDGCCSIACDWETMKKPHDFLHDERIVSDRWLFVVPVDDEGQVVPAQACHASRHDKAVRQSDASVCCLQGCGQSFPAKTTNAKNGFTFVAKAGPRTLWKVSRLCKLHHNQFSRAHARKDVETTEQLLKRCTFEPEERIRVVFPSNDKRGKVLAYYKRADNDVMWCLETSSVRVFRKNSPAVLSLLLSKFPDALDDSSDLSVPDLADENVNYAVCDSVDTIDAAERILKRFSVFQHAAGTAVVPSKVYVCPQDAVPVRTAKVHAQFRGHLLKKMMRV